MNLGHRLGEKNLEYPENTISRMMANWPYQGMSDFRYWEFDICESKDNELIVVHDRDIKMPGEDPKIANLTTQEIKTLVPHIPTLTELLNRMVDLSRNKYNGVDLVRPIRVEIKRLHSNVARMKLIEEIVRFRGQLPDKNIHCICFGSWRINHFKKSFPKCARRVFKEEFAKAEINMMKIGNHKKDLFKNPLY